MVTIWTAASFCFYQLLYELKYIKGDIFINALVSSISEVSAYLISGILCKLLGVKNIFVIGFLIAVIGMMGLILIDTDNQLALSFMVLGSMFGISNAFNIAYLGN